MLINRDKIKNFLQNIYHPYRIVVYNDHLERKATFKLTIVNLVSFFAVLICIVLLLEYLLFAFTPIKVIIPGINGNKSSIYSERLYENDKKQDSLDNLIKEYNIKINSMRKMFGDSSSSMNQEKSIFKLASFQGNNNQSIDLKDNNLKLSSDNIIFFPPVRGYISDHFSLATEHFATDIVTNKNAPVKATLDGYVLYAEWSASTGNVIILQHEKNLISIYKHNSVLLKKVGTFVHSGEAIALVGNSGELTTGPHLHFELWQNGNPLNPEEFVAF